MQTSAVLLADSHAALQTIQELRTDRMSALRDLISPLTSLMQSGLSTGTPTTPTLSEVNSPEVTSDGGGGGGGGGGGDLKVMPLVGSAAAGDQDVGSGGGSSPIGAKGQDVAAKQQQQPRVDNEAAMLSALLTANFPPHVIESSPPISPVVLPNNQRFSGSRAVLPAVVTDEPTSAIYADDSIERTSVALSDDDCLHITTDERLEAYPVSSIATTMKGHVLILGNVKPQTLQHLLSPLRAPQLGCGLDQPEYRHIVIMVPSISQLQDKEEVNNSLDCPHFKLRYNNLHM